MQNLYTSGMEWSDTQAAGKVLGNNSEYMSHDIWFVHTKPLVAYQREHQGQRREPPLPDPHHAAPPSPDNGADKHINLFDQMEDREETYEHHITTDAGGRKQVVGCPQHVNYIHRGPQLADYSPLEYGTARL